VVAVPRTALAPRPEGQPDRLDRLDRPELDRRDRPEDRLGQVGGLGQVDRLGRLAGRHRPVSMAQERMLPVLDALRPFLPGGGLRRGATVAVTGSAAVLLALLAGPSAAGSWCAAVGMPWLGVIAAAELGIALDRFALVARPGKEWPAVAAALVDGFDVVAVAAPTRLRAADARRLTARARERGAVLVAVGDGWQGADIRIRAGPGRWVGLGDGHGRLRGHEVPITVEGRGAAARPQQGRLWLPGPDGVVRAALAATRAQTRTQARTRPHPARASPDHLAVPA
jgi:hypothetical protein